MARRNETAPNASARNGSAGSAVPITITADGIEVREMYVRSRDAAAFFAELSPDRWETVACNALDIGIRCMQVAGDTRETEHLRRQLEAAVRDVEVALGHIPELVERRLTDHMGTDDGQVLAPVKALVHEASAVASARVSEVRTLLNEDLDPARETSKLGGALKTLGQLLNPDHKSSVQARVEDAINALCSVDGQLVSTVQQSVRDVVAPLTAEVDRLGLELRGKQTADEIIQQTTAKGATYEEQVLARLQRWAASAGAEVHHVGNDNKSGDVLVVIPSLSGEAVMIVVEVRSRATPLGRKAISAGLARAMDQRTAAGAVYVSATRDGLAQEIGDWAEGETSGGPFVAACEEHLVTAIRFVAAQIQIARIKRERAEVDRPAIEGQLGRIRTALGQITMMQRKLTTIRATASAVQGCADALRDEVRASLVDIEEALQRPESNAVHP
jgi:hypothetical protein